MIEFEDTQLQNLQEVEGVVLRNVHGERVAIGKGFEYENVFGFMISYFNFYTADDFAKHLGYRDAVEMFKLWFSKDTKLSEYNLLAWCIDSFGGVYADDLANEYNER
ncbi:MULTISPECIES: hypothetical protein [Lactobacillus]|uniref:hypothetical protein n=1 Tax=Lactobacillus TaxID=1578 RepID=UPI00107EB620|nr:MULTISPECIES: hypothetical protein [Lactobacillus]TGA94997.1 hypothetical protein E5F86_02605 [Lactobacillus johnsonii]